MKKVRIYTASLAEEMESIIENFEWVRDREFRRRGVHKEQISLLRRAIAARGKLTESEFAHQTRLAADVVSRAAKFLSAEDRQWVRLQKSDKDRRCKYVIGTPKGREELKKLDRQIEKKFLTSLKIAKDSEKAAKLAAAAGELNVQMRDFVGHQLRLIQ